MVNFNDYLETQLKDPDFFEEWEKSEIDYVVARNMIFRRKMFQLTQVDSAEKTGVKQSEISRIEDGNQNLTIRTLDRLAKGLNTTFSELTKRDKENEGLD